MAQRRESKFFLSGRVSPSLSDPNLQPNRCMPRILGEEEANREQRKVSMKASHLIESILDVTKTCLGPTVQ